MVIKCAKPSTELVPFAFLYILLGQVWQIKKNEHAPKHFCYLHPASNLPGVLSPEL
jgi:hypothetical protein